MSQSLIEMVSIYKSFNNTHVIKDKSIQLKSKRTYLLIGDNGSGKSTFIKLIADLYKPSKGDIIRHYKDMRYVPEIMTIKSDILVKNYIKNALSLRKLKRNKDLENHLELQLEKPLKALSKGNQKKVLLYLAFVGTPEVLCLDEPLDGLDIDMQKKVIAYLKNMPTLNIISTHAKEDFHSLKSEVIIFEVD